MLLVLTGSFDGTADLVFGELKTKAFRLNLDTFSEYEVSVQPNFWSIRNPAGLEITSKTATGVKREVIVIHIESNYATEF